MSSALEKLSERWSRAEPAERSNAQLYLTELADALGVERPRPSGAGYEFEYAVRVVARDGTETVKHADLYKEHCFLLEAKDEAPETSSDMLLRRAFGQAIEYAVFVPGESPPYLLVLDVATTLIVWDRWHGTYGGFQAGHRVDLRALSGNPDDIELLRDIWERPAARDPRARAESVTREIAQHLGELASSLEKRGHSQEEVAEFLIRVVFTLFAEDIDLLQESPFEKLVELTLSDPEEFTDGVEELWRAMDVGARFGVRKLLEYNGHFFRDARALPLTRDDLAVLLEAARADWAQVEPSIFGALFTRALDPVERHRIGAQFTPPPFVERLVRVTIEEPVRDRWILVQAEVIQLRERGRPRDAKAALKRLRSFHAELRDIRVLDPACGSGNFLYMALAALKRIELELIREVESITGNPELQIEEVDPSQFYGIEIKPWAREISELTLWIGFHQWWRQTHGYAQPPEPVLKDTGTLECRDAVLAWDETREDPTRSRPDPTPAVPSPVTGELVPDPKAKLKYMEHVNARPADWPKADFIVGNPPYMGRGRQRDAFGDGYVDALRNTYSSVPDNADYVMYWWYRAAEEVASGRTRRAGLITTNTIRQKHNRAIVESAEKAGVHVVWAIADHPWVDDAGSAAVRVSMTVISSDARGATLVEVDDHAAVTGSHHVARLNADLTAHADVARAASEPLLSNEGLSSQGFILVGGGFVLDPGEAGRFSDDDPQRAGIIKRYVTGRDLTRRPREQYVIDFGLMEHDEVREHAVLYDVVRDRVKPMRDSNNDRSTREKWWRFGRNREEFRPALDGLRRYGATVETSKHRFFIFLDRDTTPSHTIVCIALDDFYHLGVLSSSVHGAWALSAGGRLGVGNDPRYQKAHCFDPFPFPLPSNLDHDRVADVMKRLHEHRDAALARSDYATMTGLYNIVSKLKNGESLTSKERGLHELTACGVLLDLHNELDEAVAACYGWPWPLDDGEILSRLVALHDERFAEEATGLVRWLRPEYQATRFAPESGDAQTSIAIQTKRERKPTARKKAPWPESAIEQIAAVKAAVSDSPGGTEEVARRFTGARRALVERHLETLEILAEVRRASDGRFHTSGRPGGG